MEYIYAALLLHKLGKTVDEHSLKSVLKGAGVEADEAKLKTLLAALNGVDITAELANASAIASAPAAGAPAVKKEEKKEEEKPAESAAGLASLFG